MTLTAHDTTAELESSKHACSLAKVKRRPCGYLTKTLNRHRMAFFAQIGLWVRRKIGQFRQQVPRQIFRDDIGNAINGESGFVDAVHGSAAVPGGTPEFFLEQISEGL